MAASKDPYFGVDSKQDAYSSNEYDRAADGPSNYHSRGMPRASAEAPPAYTEYDQHLHSAATMPPMLPPRTANAQFYVSPAISRSLSTNTAMSMMTPSLHQHADFAVPIPPPLPHRNMTGVTLAPSLTQPIDPSMAVLDDTEIELKSSKELLATHVFDFSRPIFIHSTLETKASLTIISDNDINNQDNVRVVAHLVGKSSGIQDKVKVAVHVNKEGEYDFWVSATGSFWTKTPQCQITICMPPTVVRYHPGIRAETPCGRIEMTAVSNIDFEYLRLNSNLCEISLSNATCRLAQLVTGSAKINVSNTKVAGVLKAHTVSDALTFENVVAGTIFATTTKGVLSMINTTAGNIAAETSKSAIKTQNISAGTASFRTTGATIQVDGIKANSLVISTSDAKIEGKWAVRDMLDIVTTKSRIEGSVELTEPHLPVKLRFATTDARICVTLPGDSFRGIVDARTVDSSVSVEVKKKKLRVAPDLNKLVNDKYYKRVMVGSGVHDFAATTTNSKVEVKLA